jgi:signal transduction histidine kinase
VTKLAKTIALSKFYQSLHGWITQLRAQAILLIIILLSLVLILTTGVALLAYQQVSQSLAESRDQELAIVSAERLSESMEGFARGLKTLANQDEMQSGEPTLQERTLERGRDLIADFINHDGGIIILDPNGFVSVTNPFRPDLVGQDFSQEPYFQNARAFPTSTFFSDIIKEPTSGEDIIVIAVPIININDEFAGVIAGRFYLSFQRLGQEIQKLKVGEEGTAYLVDRNGRLIYHPISKLIGTDFSNREAVKQLKQASRVGAVTTQEQPRTVEGYAVVEVTGWGLVIGEPWTQVVEPAQKALGPIAIVLAIGLITVAIVVALGVQRVTDPIRNLVTQTQQVTAGDYDAQVNLSRIKEIKELGMAFNKMVEQIRRYRAGVREYVADVTQTQEEERRRIARELHDDTVQSLIAIGQRIELIKETLDNPVETRSRLSEVRTMVTGSIASVRQFSRDLRPLALEDLGLRAAMQYLVNQLAQSEGIDVELEVEGEIEGLSNDMEMAIYRILQETLNNIKKHAYATEVNVWAKFTKEQITLTVKDNGRGFEMPEAMTDFASSGSFGMMGLQERVQLFRGNVTVESQPNKGTTVRIVMPRQSDVAQLEVHNVSPVPDSKISERRFAADKA